MPAQGGWRLRPVRVQVITYAPTVFYHCQHCELTFKEAGLGDSFHREQAREALPEDLRHEYEVVSSWLHDVVHRFGRRVEVRLVDAASIEGFWKSLRHGVRRYPAVIVQGDRKHVDNNLDSAGRVIEQFVTAPSN
jgi:hypothetical protein